MRRIRHNQGLAVDRDSFLEEVYSVPGGDSIRWCIQCGTCSGSCPSVTQMDYSPRQTIALIRSGRSHDVLTGNSMWVCASCYLCTVRCPKEVKITELMHALERLSVHHGLISRRTSTPIMYRAFVDSVKSNGRIHELGMMIKFFLKTNPLASLKILPVGLSLFLHGRMSIKPRKIKGTEQIKAMVKRAQTLGGV